MTSLNDVLRSLLFIVPSVHPPPARVHTFQSSAVVTFLRAEMRRRQIPGLQIAVVRHGEIVLHGAYGTANIQDSVPVDDRTVFSINSITKAFVGVAIMQLVERRQLDLSAPVSRYLDGLPVAWRPVTVRQLATHMSGLPNIMDNNATMVSDSGDDASWAKVITIPMEFAPGERFSYNQTNYLLLGRIIEKLSGQPFDRFIAEEQLRVVGMPLTLFGDSRDVLAHSARGYTHLRKVGLEMVATDKLANLFEEFPPFLRTAAGMNSTAEELARWVIALQNGRLLREKSSLDTLWKPGVLNNGSTGGFSRLLNGYAVGWPIVGRVEHRAAASVGGGRSAIFVYPDDDLAIVILTNMQGCSPESFIDEVAGYYIPDMRGSTGFGLPLSIRALRAELLKRGFQHAIDVARDAKAKDSTFKLDESDVNAWGYLLVQQGLRKEAIEVFKLNVSLYPESANTYDSLAEAYEPIDEAIAIDNYRRSLVRDPKNTHAVERLKVLATR